MKDGFAFHNKESQKTVMCKTANANGILTAGQDAKEFKFSCDEASSADKARFMSWGWGYYPYYWNGYGYWNGGHGYPWYGGGWGGWGSGGGGWGW